MSKTISDNFYWRKTATSIVNIRPVNILIAMEFKALHKQEMITNISRRYLLANMKPCHDTAPFLIDHFPLSLS